MAICLHADCGLTARNFKTSRNPNVALYSSEPRLCRDEVEEMSNEFKKKQ